MPPLEELELDELEELELLLEELELLELDELELLLELLELDELELDELELLEDEELEDELEDVLPPVAVQLKMVALEPSPTP